MRTRSPAIVLGAMLLAALPVGAVEPLPDLPRGRCVLDATGALDASSAARLEELCEGLDRSGAGQLAVAVVSELGARTSEEYAVDLFARWRLGHAGKDDGVLVLLKIGPPGKRAVRVEVGYGLEGDLPDAIARRLVDDLAMPGLRDGRWGEGLVPLVRELVTRIEAARRAGGSGESVATGVAAGAAEASTAAGAAASGAAGPTFDGPEDSAAAGAVLIVLIGLVLLAVLGVMRLVHHIPGRGTYVLGGLFGVAALGVDAGLGGPLWAWLLIPIGIMAFLGGAGVYAVRKHRCRCGGWLDFGAKTVVTKPTFTAPGLAHIAARCRVCGGATEVDETIPALTPPGGGGGGRRSSSGGSGGFSGGGGGRSGGGGFGRSF